MPESGPRCSCWRGPCARFRSCGACSPQSSPFSPPEQGEQVISEHSFRCLAASSTHRVHLDQLSLLLARAGVLGRGAEGLWRSAAVQKRVVSAASRALSGRQSTRLRLASCECTRGVRASVTRTAGEAAARCGVVQATALTLAGDGLRKAVQGATADAAAVQAIVIPDAHTQGVLRVATPVSAFFGGAYVAAGARFDQRRSSQVARNPGALPGNWLLCVGRCAV